MYAAAHLHRCPHNKKIDASGSREFLLFSAGASKRAKKAASKPKKAAAAARPKAKKPKAKK
jgi:hypothetical protein